MQNIEEIAFQTYTDNLNYLKEHQTKLYEKITLLNNLIEEGAYKEKFALEYKDEGYFDVKDLLNDEYLYKENSTQHASRMCDMVNKKRTGGIFKAQKFSYLNDIQADHVDKGKLTFHSSLWATIKLTNYVTRYASAETYMRKVPKVIFLDIGLGLHIHAIVEKLKSIVVFIKEPNIELLRLSLFTTNYSLIAKNRYLFFSSTNNEIEEQNEFLNFLNQGNNYNLHMKYIPFSDNYQSQLRSLQGHVLSQSYINYGYSAILLRYITSPIYLAQNYHFLNLSQMYSDTVFTQKPVLLLFSGPSTSRNLEWIKENHERFIIISALSTCKLLQSINITPDIVIHMDPGEATALLFDGLDTESYFQNTSILLSANVNQDTVNRFNPANIHFIEQGTTYKKGFGKLSAPSVGEYAYAISLAFGSSKIFMLGIDLALDEHTLQTHGDFHIGQLQGVNDQSASLNPSASIEYVKGNFKDKIPTLSSYKISIDQYEIFANLLQSEKHTVYNLSNGAYLSKSLALKTGEYKWEKLPKLDKKELFKEIKEFILSIGSDDFNEEDKEQIRHQVKEAKKLKKLIVNYQKNRYIHSGIYLQTFSKLAFDLSDMERKNNSDLAEVYYEYFQMIQSYIYDLFNTQSLEDEKKHMKELNKILVRQLLKISNLYLETMENYIK